MTPITHSALDAHGTLMNHGERFAMRQGLILRLGARLMSQPDDNVGMTFGTTWSKRTMLIRSITGDCNIR